MEPVPWPGWSVDSARGTRERSEVGGLYPSGSPNREIGFGFVSCSCRACVRAGEAKLRGRVRGCASQRWWPERKHYVLEGCFRGLLWIWPLDLLFAFLLLFAWVLRGFCILCCYLHWF